MENPENEYSSEFSEGSFWEKIRDFAVKAGKELIEKALILYFCFQDKDTPKWAKVQILGALGYFISPIDAIPDVLPGGLMDDLGALVMTVSAVALYIKEEHKQAALDKLDEWFGGDEPESEITPA